MKKITYQNGKRINESNHDWWMYVWLGIAAGIFIAAFLKWWYCL